MTKAIFIIIVRLERKRKMFKALIICLVLPLG